MKVSRDHVQLALTWAFTLATLIVINWLGLPLIAGERAGLLEDDSYFYANIAYNSWRQSSFTFDGLQPTSGFHPLWMILLSAVAQFAGVFTDDKALHLATYLTAWLVPVLFLASRLGVTRLNKVAFVALALLTAPLMETALLSLLCVLALERILQTKTKGRLDLPLLFVAALIPLTRVDATPFIALWMLPLGRDRSRSIALGVGLLLGVLTHLVFFQALFGHPFAVSSLLKASVLTGNGSLFRAVSKGGIVGRVLLLLALLTWAWPVARRWATQDRRVWVLVGAPVAFTISHIALSDIRSWYFLPAFVVTFWVASQGGSLEARPPAADPPVSERLLPQLVVLAIFSLNVYKLYRFIPLDRVRRESWNFVDSARDLLPRDAKVYQVDGSGFTGFWLDRHLINGDGLVNTYAYARRLRTRKLKGYLAETGVCYLVTDAPLSGDGVLVKVGGLVVHEDAATELLRSNAYGWSKNRNAHFILWRLREKHCHQGVRGEAPTLTPVGT